MATVTATAAGTNTGSAWRTEQHSAVTDKALSEFSLERYNMLMTNTLRVNQLAYETVSTAENLAPTLARLETSQANDLLFITQSIMTVRSNCEELKCTAVSSDWPPVTLVAGSMTDGLYGLRYTIPSPGSPCNSFALTTLHCRRCRNWISLKSAETLFPSCKLPHCSYTHAEFNCFRRCGPDTVEILTGTAFKGDVATTGQTAQTMCIATTLSTAMEILNTGVIPISLFTNGQVNCWFTPRSALLRAFQMHWTGITLALDEPMVVICYNPSLHRFLTTATVHQLTTNFVTESRTVEALTAFNRLYYDHCWTTGSLEENMALNSVESRTGFGIQLPFTAREIIEALEVELNCNQLFGNHYRGLVGHCILTDNQLRLTHDDIYTECTWKSIYTDDSLPIKKKKKKNKVTVQDETVRTDFTGKVNVEITGLPISTDGVTLTITGSN